jgi:hypothetical protein
VPPVTKIIRLVKVLQLHYSVSCRIFYHVRLGRCAAAYRGSAWCISTHKVDPRVPINQLSLFGAASSNASEFVHPQQHGVNLAVSRFPKAAVQV